VEVKNRKYHSTCLSQSFALQQNYNNLFIKEKYFNFIRSRSSILLKLKKIQARQPQQKENLKTKADVRTKIYFI